jgi:hypothetical protein
MTVVLHDVMVVVFSMKNVEVLWKCFSRTTVYCIVQCTVLLVPVGIIMSAFVHDDVI